MSAVGLTRLQRDCMRVIQELTAAKGIAPSYQEIADELCLASKSLVFRLVECLILRGYLAHLKAHGRSLKIIVPVPMAEDVEIVGLFDDLDLAACFVGGRDVAS